MLLFQLLVVISMAADSSHAHGHSGPSGHHGNPSDLTDYVARLDDPSRAAWQKPDEVVKALGLKAGQSVCDIGVGPGYFTKALARVTGPDGTVFAVDVEARLLAVLRDRLAKAAISNVVPILALPDDPLLPKKSCDVVLIVDTYHHFPDGPAYLRRLLAALKPGGRIVNIDFHKRELPVGPPVDHKISREDFLAQASTAGLKLLDEKTFLPHQYFLILGL